MTNGFLLSLSVINVGGQGFPHAAEVFAVDALAAVAGVMITMYYGVIDFFIGFLAGVKAFTAAVLGGIGSLPGAMLGGLLIGLIEAFWSAYFSVEYKDVATFVILVVVLIFRPTGLLGRPEVEKV
jgi:branched-chain amino acid transport system permease protein